MTTNELWDPACEELAEHFLADEATSETEHEARTVALASAIQRAIEDWCATHELPATLADPEVEP